MEASRYGHLEVVEELLKAGADLHAKMEVQRVWGLGGRRVRVCEGEGRMKFSPPPPFQGRGAGGRGEARGTSDEA